MGSLTDARYLTAMCVSKSLETLLENENVAKMKSFLMKIDDDGTRGSGS